MKDKRKYVKIDKEIVLSLLKEGYQQQEIAKKLGCRKETINRLIKRENIEKHENVIVQKSHNHVSIHSINGKESLGSNPLNCNPETDKDYIKQMIYSTSYFYLKAIHAQLVEINENGDIILRKDSLDYQDKAFLKEMLKTERNLEEKLDQIFFNKKEEWE